MPDDERDYIEANEISEDEQPDLTMESLYPGGRGYHQAHEAYIGAVAWALQAVNLATPDWFADPNDPRDGAIKLDSNLLDTSADEVHLCWQEERGWWLLKEYEREDDENQKVVTDLDCATVASPSSVASAVREHFGIPPGASLSDDYPDEDFPDHQFDDDDVAFELALRRYAEPAGGDTRE